MLCHGQGCHPPAHAALGLIQPDIKSLQGWDTTAFLGFSWWVALSQQQGAVLSSCTSFLFPLSLQGFRDTTMSMWIILPVFAYRTQKIWISLANLLHQYSHVTVSVPTWRTDLLGGEGKSHALGAVDNQGPLLSLSAYAHQHKCMLASLSENSNVTKTCLMCCCSFSDSCSFSDRTQLHFSFPPPQLTRVKLWERNEER